MNNSRRLAFIALFSALLGMLSQIALPLPAGVPLTLQTFAVALCGCVLGGTKGSISVFVWLVLGAVGLPLFSGFRGGFAVLFGPTGGFLMGLIFLALFCGLGGTKRFLCYCGLAVMGLVLCHACGTLWFSVVAEQNLRTAAVTVSFPYLLKDVLSLGAARVCARFILRSFPSLRNNAR